MTDIGKVTPKLSEDVSFTTALQWSGDAPPVGSFKLNWTIDNGMAGDLAIAADTLSARLVTSGSGDFDAKVVVTSPDGGQSDTCTVSRHAGIVTVIGLAAAVVPKQ